jgi:ribosome-associated heat shock protein Hsp15
LAGPAGKSAPSAAPRLRLDRWLFVARFARSREAAAALVGSGHLRINARPCVKPGHGVGVGDVLTFPQGAQIRVIRITALSPRRGPADAARALYDDLAPRGADAGQSPAAPLE